MVILKKWPGNLRGADHVRSSELRELTPLAAALSAGLAPPSVVASFVAGPAGDDGDHQELEYVQHEAENSLEERPGQQASQDDDDREGEFAPGAETTALSRVVLAGAFGLAGHRYG